MKIFGKKIYYLVFRFFVLLVKLRSLKKDQLWVRNSILENYFSFGKSDLDLTVLLDGNDNIFSRVNTIHNYAKSFIIIKELNYYYPFAIVNSKELINYFEWKRDKYLHHHIQKAASLEENDNEKIVYFLRTFFSIKIPLDIPLNNRQIKKWEFHLKSLSLPVSDILNPGINTQQLLQNVCRYFFIKESNVVSKRIIDLYLATNNGTSMDIFIEKSNEKDFYLTFFPHVFCFNDFLPTFGMEKSIEIFSKQISWEVWAMMTQPWLCSGSIGGIDHLNNLKKLLLRCQRDTGIFKDNHSVLMSSIDSYLDFLSSQPKA